MDLRSTMDKLKNAFTIGGNNSYLLGPKAGKNKPAPEKQQRAQGMEGQGNYAAYPQGDMGPDQGRNYYNEQPSYRQQGPQHAYPPQRNDYAQAPQMQQPPQQAYVAQSPYMQQPNVQPVQRQGTPAPRATGFQQGYQPPQYQETVPYSVDQGQQRNPRAPRHDQAPENVVPFPGAQDTVPSSQATDAYVINIVDIPACRHAMSCLRKGQCVIIVIDQLTDRVEIRRYVDMLMGASYALGGNFTRLSAKAGFYLLSPASMSVYTDPITSSISNPRPAQAMGNQQQGQHYTFTPQGTPELPDMNFSQQQPLKAAYAAQQDAGMQAAQYGQQPYQPQNDPYQGYAYGTPEQPQEAYDQYIQYAQ